MATIQINLEYRCNQKECSSLDFIPILSPHLFMNTEYEELSSVAIVNLENGSFNYHYTFDSTGETSQVDLSDLYPYFLLIALCVLLVFIAIMFKRRRYL